MLLISASFFNSGPRPDLAMPGSWLEWQWRHEQGLSCLIRRRASDVLVISESDGPDQCASLVWPRSLFPSLPRAHPDLHFSSHAIENFGSGAEARKRDCVGSKTFKELRTASVSDQERVLLGYASSPVR